jgi:ABC-type multidrug transport system ATPase subunit
VSFNLDEKFEEIIKSRHRDEFTYDSFSEGEKMRIDLALLFTWRTIAKMKNSVNTNLLILDEVFDSSLDVDGTEEFLKILNKLTGKQNVFIISHKGDVLYDKFDNVIKFSKEKNFSKII